MRASLDPAQEIGALLGAPRMTPNTATPLKSFQPENLLDIEEVARRLRNNVAWVREKVRRRSPNPMPVYNLGRHLLFDWDQVSEWIRNSPRLKHSAHRRRTKKQIQRDTLKKAA
jgi:hypothetical protein